MATCYIKNNKTYTGTELDVAFFNTKAKKFLQDFNFDIKEYDSIKSALGYDSNQMIDLASKFVAVEEDVLLDKSLAYVGYMFLGKENSKIKSDLRFRIKNWDRYEEVFNRFKEQVSKEEGYIENKSEWINKIRDKVIVEFLSEHIVEYAKNPQEFEKTYNRKWTQEDFTFFQKLLRKILNLFKSKQQDANTITNLAYQLSHEILNREYDILDYNLAEDQIQKYYKDTIEQDPQAKDIVEFSQKEGIVLTGSLALRYAGTVYRTEQETLHDLDFVVPYNINKEEKELKALMTYKAMHPDMTLEEFGNVTFKMIDEFSWFQKLQEKYPTYKKLYGFYGKEHKSFESYTLTGVIDGQFYESNGTHTEVNNKGITVTKKHKKGEYIKDTGYIIDHFVRMTPNQEEHENYFKLWKEIMIAKLKMGRSKDLTDFKYFVPFTKSTDSFNFYYKDWVYQSLGVSKFKRFPLITPEQQEQINNCK